MGLELEPVMAVAGAVGATTSLTALGKALVEYFTAPLAGRTDARREHARGRELERLSAPVGSVEQVRLGALRELVDVKLGDQALVVVERVLVKAAIEAMLTGDPVVCSYLGGVLAGVDDPNDDAATAVLAQIGRLSSLELRMHFVCYRAFWRLERAGGQLGPSGDLRDERVLGRVPLFLAARELCPALGVSGGQATAARIMSAGRGLAREELFGHEQPDVGVVIKPQGGPRPPWRYDSATTLAMFYGQVFPDAGLVFQPTPAGIELFLWGCGARDHDPVAIRRLETLQGDDVDVPACSAVRLDRLPR